MALMHDNTCSIRTVHLESMCDFLQIYSPHPQQVLTLTLLFVFVCLTLMVAASESSYFDSTSKKHPPIAEESPTEDSLAEERPPVKLQVELTTGMLHQNNSC